MSHAPLRLATPCRASWQAMSPTNAGRHCQECGLDVIDVAGMPVAQGRDVLAAIATTLQADPGRRTCVRAHATPAGRLVPGSRRPLTHALAAVLASTMAGCVGNGPDLLPEPTGAAPTHQTYPPFPGKVAVAPPMLGDVCTPTPLPGSPRPPVVPQSAGPQR